MKQSYLDGPHSRFSRGEQIADVILAVVIGIAGAACLVHFIAGRFA